MCADTPSWTNGKDEDCTYYRNNWYCKNVIETIIIFAARCLYLSIVFCILKDLITEELLGAWLQSTVFVIVNLTDAMQILGLQYYFLCISSGSGSVLKSWLSAARWD